jgi:hypothetical protein
MSFPFTQQYGSYAIVDSITHLLQARSSVNGVSVRFPVKSLTA